VAGRRLGQHFLRSKPILESIAKEACSGDTPLIVEIGPGKGALTEHLLQSAERVIAVEVDQVLVHYLQQKFRNSSLKIINCDVLKTDLTQWGPVAVVGNLPYYITSPITEKVLMLGPLLKRGVFMMQKEVAFRMTSLPGSRDYGYLTVLVSLFAEAKIMFDVPAGAFSPPPKVQSSVVRLIPRPSPMVEDSAGFLEFAAAAFRQKRKTLRNNLAERYGKAAVEAQAEANMRAEQLSIEQLVDLHQRILKFP
jgi:16S rRNA (adenine1518-N6/adenine1519-N6)-dimethyltransferase